MWDLHAPTSGGAGTRRPAVPMVQQTHMNADRIAEDPRYGGTKPDRTVPANPIVPGNPYGSSAAQNKKAAANFLKVAKFNAKSTKDQLARDLARFRKSDEQNRLAAAGQKQQASSTASSDRFAQLKKLQSSTDAITASAGNALQGGQALNLAGMLRGRNDLDSGESLNTLKTNFHSIQNALADSLNANALAADEATSIAEFGLRGIEADTASQLNSLDPKLFVAPGTGKANLGSSGVAKSGPASRIDTSSGYITGVPRARTAPASGYGSGSSYFDKLMSGYRR